MNRTVGIVAAVAVVLLAANLFVSVEPEAEAQVREGIAGACCFPDGSCALEQGGEDDCLAAGGVFHVGLSCVQVNCFARRLVSVTVDKDQDSGTFFSKYRVFRAWNNGDVDVTWVRFSDTAPLCDIVDECGPVPIIPPPCPADVNDENVFLPHST